MYLMFFGEEANFTASNGKNCASILSLMRAHASEIFPADDELVTAEPRANSWLRKVTELFI